MINLFLLTATVAFFIGHFKIRYGGWIPYLAIEGLVFLLVGVTLLRATRDRSVFQRVPVTRIYGFLALYAATAILRPGMPAFSGLMGYRALLICPALMFVGFISFTYERQLRRVYVALAILASITAAIGIYQWNVGPSVVATWGGYYPDFARKMIWTRVSQNEFVFRAFSTFVQPGVFGAAMACVMVTCLAYILSARTKLIARILFCGVFVLLGAGMIVSASRLSIAIVVLCAAIMAALKQRLSQKTRLLLQAAAVCSVMLWIALDAVGPVFIERLQSVGTMQSFFWRWAGPTIEGLRRGFEAPMGIGLGYTNGLPYFVNDSWLPEIDQSGRNIDSGIGAIAVELGLPGLLLYIAFTCSVAAASVRSWRILPPGHLRDLLSAPTALAILGVPLMPIANLMQPAYPFALMYWFLIGMLMKAPYIAMRAPRNVVSAPNVARAAPIQVAAAAYRRGVWQPSSRTR